MEQFVGMDVSQEFTHLCVIDSSGTIVWQGKCDSTPDDIAKNIKAKAPLAARIGLESGALCSGPLGFVDGLWHRA
jgi:transposase